MFKKPLNAISVKLIAPLVITFVLAISFCYALFEHNARHLVDNFVEKRAYELAELLVINIETNNTKANLIRVVNSIGSYEDVASLFLVDRPGQYILASNKNRYIDKQLNNLVDLSLKSTLMDAIGQAKNVFTEHLGSHQHKLVYHFNAISMDKRRFQPLTLVLILNEQDLSLALSKFLSPLLLSQTLAIVIAGVFFYIAARIVIIRPINKLVKAIGSARKNNNAISVEHTSNDEFGVLVDNYNELMTSLHNYQSRLIEAKEKSDAATQAKSEFLATMTHELRTPLNGVIGMSELLNGQNLTKQQKYFVDTINQSGTQLLAIINDILDFSKIESGRFELSNIAFSLNDLVQQTCLILEFQAKDKGLKLSFSNNLSPSPSLILGDDVRLKQVLINIIGNAIKFTSAGSVQISIEHASSFQTTDDTKQLEYVIKIKDTGIGLSQDQIDNLFKQFTQADSSTTRKFGGTGLGLAICKQICKKMGGSISVKSTLGEGAEFLIQLSMPIIDTKDVADTPNVNTTDLNSLAHRQDPKHVDELWHQRHFVQNNIPPKVLVVDDTFINLEVVSAILEAEDIEVVRATDGLFAVEEFNNNSFDLILMDCLMPNMDGYQAALEIRHLEDLSNEENELEDTETTAKTRTPIIALTASALQETKDKCVKAGMDDFIAKPFKSDQLITTIKWWLIRNLKD